MAEALAFDPAAYPFVTVADACAQALRGASYLAVTRYRTAVGHCDYAIIGTEVRAHLNARTPDEEPATRAAVLTVFRALIEFDAATGVCVTEQREGETADEFVARHRAALAVFLSRAEVPR